MLGLLLLRPNQVVATSELLGALWPDESRPMTARKIVQNAVSGLRTTLSVHHTRDEPQGAGAPELITRAPGYVLRVDPARLDMTRFDGKATAGRAKLAAGEPAAAAELLREALAEWRGPALSDLMEQGLDWPEVAACGSCGWTRWSTASRPNSPAGGTTRCSGSSTRSRRRSRCASG